MFNNSIINNHHNYQITLEILKLPLIIFKYKVKKEITWKQEKMFEMV